MHLKQTKIICTIAGNNCQPEFIQTLFDAGMNVARLNTAHISPAEAAETVANIRQVSDQIGIFVDTKGPEVRTDGLEETLEVKEGDIITIASDHMPERGFKVNYEHFITEVPDGSDILIDDGEMHLRVTNKTATSLTCEVTNDGEIKNRKSVNVPNASLHMPALTEKDISFIEWAVTADIDFIAHSFVRHQADVKSIQDILDKHNSPIKIIAKIENREGVDNLDSILDVVHSVMVARGDLGIEIPAEEVPAIQKHMISTCIQRAKPVITATQMLHTMIDNPRPTRAEVSDVANAIYDGTDALMLSGESAYGKYAVEAVTVMANIAENVETQKNQPAPMFPVHKQTKELMPRNHLAEAAVSMASSMPAQAIVLSTKTGDTAQICAAHRGRTPIFALTENMRTVRELALTYGVYAEKIDIPKTTDDVVSTCVGTLLEEKHINEDELVVFIGGGHLNSSHTNFIQVDTPKTLLKK